MNEAAASKTGGRGSVRAAGKRPHSQTSFTLVELVVVVLVIGLLAALIVPAMARARESQRRGRCLSNLRQIRLAFKQTAVDGSDWFPTNKNNSSNSAFAVLTNGNYLSIGKVYLCPDDLGKSAGSEARFDASNCSYSCVVGDSAGGAMNEGMGVDNPLIFDAGMGTNDTRVEALAKASAQWIASPHGQTVGGNIFYLGGRASFEKFFKCGTDGTNGVLKIPGPM